MTYNAYNKISTNNIEGMVGHHPLGFYMYNVTHLSEMTLMK